MQIAFLGVVFLVIVLLLALRRPLYQAILGGLVFTVILYRIPTLAILRQTANVFTNWGSLTVLVSLYLISFLQRMMEARSLIKHAQQDMNGLFHNRRVNAGGMPLFIGLLPSAAAMLLCGDIVKDATDGHLAPREQAFLTTWFRHIPESILPTYSGVLLMTNLSGLPLPKFIMGMIIPAIVLGLLAYIPYLRKIPKDPGTPRSANRAKDALNLLLHLWPVILILALLLVFKISVVPAVVASIVVCALVYRFPLAELGKVTVNAFEFKLLLNTFLVLVLKEFIAYTGVLELLPQALSHLPVPNYIVFAALFFLGGIVSGSNGIIALGTPLAFAAMPEGGVPLMVLLMCMSHAASQISPTHVCLVVASEYYDIRLGALIRRSIPFALIFVALMIGYYNLLVLI